MRGLSLATDSVRYPLHIENLPRAEIADGKYVVRFARNIEELEAVLKLRFEVFNLELGEGLDASFRTGRDRDHFDASCHHLMVLEKSSLKIVGTYRVRTIEMAGNTKGFYSAGEFDLTCLPPGILAESVELGRACIAREHRNRQVLFLLWKALIVYLTSNRKRFFFGCCSLTSQDPRDGIEVLNYLARNGYMHPTLMVPPQPGYECVVNGFCAFARTEVKIPRLFDTYLGIGAKVCGGPAIDRLFKTIDFLVIFDIQQMDEKTHRLLFTV